MSYPAGTRLGPYEISSSIGVGGMGEVFRARDTRLGRDVAIKILPAELAQSAQFKIRFEREARTISQLSHPHICTLYDVGENYLVMELLEGETLADRIARGRLPIQDVLRYGREIAEALHRAHQAGITHRDLKPGNVMITKSGTKLLDFGLAKIAAPVIAIDGATQQKPLTQEGTILGTFQYMAPEQLEGIEADHRTDIFGLGAVLYEMATGVPAFTGKTKTSLIAAIVKEDPRPLSELQPLTPPALDHVISKCLAKDPDQRWQSAHDIAEELLWISERGSQAGVAAPLVRRRVFRERTAWGLLAATTLAAAAFATGFFLRAPKQPRTMRFIVETPESATLFPFDEKGIALSPDGSRLAFVASIGDRRMIYIRALSSTKAEPLAGTDDATYPFWSPDGRYIGFFAAGMMKRIDASGGPPQVICEASLGRGATWNKDGVIVFTPKIRSPLFRVSAAGGTAVRLNFSGNVEGRGAHRWPSFLPDGRHFLFTGASEVFVASLDSPDVKQLVADGSNAVFSPPDQLIFSRSGVLMSQKFDPAKLTTEGEAAPIGLEPVSWWGPKRLAVFSVANDGTLAFLPATTPITRLVWLDRSGRDAGSIGEPGEYGDAALSTDGKTVAVVKGPLGNGDIWLMHVADGRWSRLTFRPGTRSGLTWSRDDSQLAFMSQVGDVGQPFIKELTRDADPVRIASTNEWTVPQSFSPDGRTLVVVRQMPDTAYDLYSISLKGAGAITPILETPFVESHARLSPDGKWMAYDSNESGRAEVYIRRFPPTAEQWQVSTNGGISPAWRADGAELFYVGGNQLMAAPIPKGERLTPGIPKPLFPIGPDLLAVSYGYGGASPLVVAATPDGQKFLMRRSESHATTSLNIVVNWKNVQERAGTPAAAR